MSNRYPHRQRDIDKAFEKIRVEKLDKLPRAQEPRFMVIGGQPGAGKSETIRELKRNAPDLYVIDVDKLRKEHPQYALIQHKEGIGAANYTHKFASALKDKIVDYLRGKQVDFALEATLGNKDRTLELMQNPLWKQNSYQIEVHGVVVPKEISEIGVVKRYFDGRNQTEIIQLLEVDKRRYVPALAREKSYEGMLRTLVVLAENRAVDTIGLYDRDGKELYLAHGNQISPDRIRNVVVENRGLENTSSHQLETALENHAYNQSQNEHIQAQPAHTPAEQNEQKILAADMKQELNYAKDIEKALPKAKKKERQEKRDERLKKRVEENKDKGQSQNRDKIRDKDIQDRGRTR